ncbi:uncharacterized protein LOC125744753 [Brienomyrus brachyistius]|uniref:uncharacterized protein LOC125744753 n=1 Tax=Brienomyrus brachyistius TaxID=42636 RepID=UPI0020B31172|nr:uncharacterized protein LOC125744753 [Brienomyrus brachyistius]
MDDDGPLLPDRNQEGADLLSPNLRPRHQDLIPTPCGPIKSWSELSCLVKLYYCFTIVSLLAIFGLTVYNIYNESQETYSHEEDFTVSLIQLVGITFCVYYITRGVLQENRQELIVFVLCVLLLMIRSVVNFIVLTSEERVTILARFVCILCLGLVHLICGLLLIQMPNMMAFRVGGALESLQEQYFLLNLCFSMVTFDLQAQLCLCILIMTAGISVSYSHSIILGFGIFWAFLTALVGAAAVLKEKKPLVWLFVLQNLPELAYFIYLLYTIIVGWGNEKSYALEAAAITCSLISVLIKVVLFGSLFRLYRSFGQGLRERMFASPQE